MEICTIRISKQLLQTLVDSDVISTEDFEVKLVDEKSFDYTTDELWKAQKTKSDKEYKKLKEIEFNLRNK